MLEQVARIALRADYTRVSQAAAGRFTAGLGRYLRLLRRMAEDDPDQQFWDILQRVVLKILKYLLSGRT